ncbi:sulfurtransferase TusA family protein [Fervidobacterium sp.]
MKKKKHLTIEKLFSLLSNQKRLEILMAVFDNYHNASEVAEIVGVDISTAYRYLKSMKEAGILSSRYHNGKEYFDFSSADIYKLLELALEFVDRVNGKTSSNTQELKELLDSEPLSERDFTPDIVLDMRGEICPVPDLATQRKLQEMKEGQVLLVIVDYQLSGERIPYRAKQLGHEVITKKKDSLGNIYIYIRCKKNENMHK